MIHYTSPYLLDPGHAITVELIGCGGTGSHVLKELARINAALLAIGRPGIFVRAWDPDHFTEPNIGRQVLSPSDFGTNKATVLVTRINRYYGFGWSAMDRHFTGAAETGNIIVTCIDTPQGRCQIGANVKGKATEKRMDDTDRPFYWLDFGNKKSTGQAVLGTFAPVKQPRSNEGTRPSLKNVLQVFPQIKREKAPRNAPSCSAAEALESQDLFINSALAQWGCQLLWKLIRAGQISHHGVFVNTDTMTTVPMAIK